MVNVVSTIDQKLSELPIFKGLGRFATFQGKDSSVIVGARGEMGGNIVASVVRGDVGSMRQDIDEQALHDSRSEVHALLGKGAKKHKLSEAQLANILRQGLVGPSVVFSRNIPTEDIDSALSTSRADAVSVVRGFIDDALPDDETAESYKDAMLVVEAGPELLQFKQDQFQFFDLALKEGAILASNTSSLKLADIASKVSNPQNVVGLHFFKPAAINPLVEIIATEQTDPEVIEAMRQFSLSMGKMPIVVWGDEPGAVANRILVGVLNELGKIADEGEVSPDFLDKVFIETFYSKQYEAKTRGAISSFKAAPKLALFKDEVGKYAQIKELEKQIRENGKKGWKGAKANEKLFAKKLALIKAAQGELGQKRLYASIVENLSVLGTFYKPSERVAEAKGKAAAQMQAVGAYLKKVEENGENIALPFEIEPYELTDKGFSRANETPDKKEEVKQRLQAAYIAIAQEVHDIGLASKHDIEVACKQGFKWNEGPFEMLSKLGAEDTVDIMRNHIPEYADEASGIASTSQIKEVTSDEISGVRSYIQEGVGFIELGRLHIQNMQQMQNSLSPEMLRGISRALKELQESGAKSIAFKSQGGGSFSAGADLAYAQSVKDDTAKLKEFVALGRSVMKEVKNCPLPTVALIDGPAVGGGAELACACDYRIMTDKSFIAFPELGLGLDPEWLGTELFPEIVGKDLAKALILQVKNPLKAPRLFANEALDAGFADSVVLQNELYPFFASVMRGEVDGIDLSAKPDRKQNYDNPIPDSLSRRHQIKRPMRFTSAGREVARRAERFIDNSHDPEFGEVNRDDNFAATLQTAFKAADRKIQFFVGLAKGRFAKWLG